MKRRKALRQIGVGLSAGLLGPQFLASCKKESIAPEVNYKGSVIVIGAGASGIYAADILSSKGISVSVLEASGQIGGRIRSVRNQAGISNISVADFPVELGAEVLFGSDTVWGNIIKNLNLATTDLSTAVNQYILDNTAKSASDWGADADLAAVQNFITNIGSYSGADVSVRSAANVSDRAQALLNSEGGNYYGSSSDNISAKALSDGLKLITHDMKLQTLTHNPWQDILVSRFINIISNVKLNTAVKAIDYSSADTVVVTDTNGNQYKANKVIVTVPVTVLKNNGIAFSPGLPSSMTSSLSKIGMDACIRVLIDFKKNFWGDTSGFIWGGTTAPQYFNAGVGRSTLTQTLSITINGPKAQELSALSNDAIVTQILAELDGLYKGQATQYIRRDIDTNKMLYILQDWTKEQYIQGGYSYAPVGTTIDDRTAIGAPINKKLFFAGEATDVSGEAGSVNGAFNSAERVVTEVVKSITG